MDDDQENPSNPAGTRGGIFGLILILIIGWWVWSHLIHKPAWTAIYYPSAGDLSYFIDKDVGSLQECRDWVAIRAQAQNNTGYDYECGSNCKLQHDAGGRFYRCDETKE